jgi:hypothetical protein
MYGHGGVVISREVPWRDATGLRTATREDLLRLLVPVAMLPTFELMSGHVDVRIRKAGEHSVLGSLTVYVEPSTPDRLIVPDHRSEIFVTSDGGTEVCHLTVMAQPGGSPEYGIPKPDSDKRVKTIERGMDQVIIHSAGQLVVSWEEALASNVVSRLKPLGQETLYVEVRLRPVGADVPAVIGATMQPTDPRSRNELSWNLEIGGVVVDRLPPVGHSRRYNC